MFKDIDWELVAFLAVLSIASALLSGLMVVLSF